jgi:drug/metabolite transporter (DMT)-like permease
VTFVVPAFAIAWGSIVLGEPVGIGLLAGFGLVIVSLVLVLGIRIGARAGGPCARVACRWCQRPSAGEA